MNARVKRHLLSGGKIKLIGGDSGYPDTYYWIEGDTLVANSLPENGTRTIFSVESLMKWRGVKFVIVKEAK